MLTATDSTRVYRWHPSPNFDARAKNTNITCVILHYTGMQNAAMALARLCDGIGDNRVSAHYLLDEGGDVVALVDETQRAWHAGAANWRGITDINSVSIGIELVNPGHHCGYRPFPQAQIDACVALLKTIIARHAFDPTHIWAHSDVAPDRKEDPGELFPWDYLAHQGLGLWPNRWPEPTHTTVDMNDIRGWLRRIGYACPADGDYDRVLRKALLAFQRHWLPANLSGMADPATSARLKQLAELCN